MVAFTESEAAEVTPPPTFSTAEGNERQTEPDSNQLFPVSCIVLLSARRGTVFMMKPDFISLVQVFAVHSAVKVLVIKFSAHRGRTGTTLVTEQLHTVAAPRVPLTSDL